MKRYLLIFILLIWMFTACALKPTEQPSPSGSPSQWTPSQSAAISALSATLNLPPEQITLISTEAVDWPDGCLGIQKVGMMCTQMVVPGFKIILEVNGKQYEYHTNKNGSVIVRVSEIAVNGSAQEIVIKQLASNLGLKESDVSVVSSSDVEFSDACLGVAMKDVMCAQVATSGKIIVLKSGGIQYQYHLSNDGRIVQPATIALTWTRNGGIAGFCDSLTVFLSGEVYGNQCKSQPNETMGIFANLLSKDEHEQFNAWIMEFGQVDLNASDPKGVSDRMEVTLTFHGNGKGMLSKSDEQKLLLWAQTLFQKLNS